jgi:hypothetical protein
VYSIETERIKRNREKEEERKKKVRIDLFERNIKICVYLLCVPSVFLCLDGLEEVFAHDVGLQVLVHTPLLLAHDILQLVLAPLLHGVFLLLLLLLLLAAFLFPDVGVDVDLLHFADDVLVVGVPALVPFLAGALHKEGAQHCLRVHS